MRNNIKFKEIGEKEVAIIRRIREIELLLQGIEILEIKLAKTLLKDAEKYISKGLKLI